MLPTGPRTVVVAGDDAGPPARLLAEQASWPLLAEPSSGSRTGENAIRTYRLLLGSEGPGLPDAVLARARTVSIPMAAGFDSLNVATTAGIALHQLVFG